MDGYRNRQIQAVKSFDFLLMLPFTQRRSDEQWRCVGGVWAERQVLDGLQAGCLVW
jgi:hypothetical protein